MCRYDLVCQQTWETLCVVPVTEKGGVVKKKNNKSEKRSCGTTKKNSSNINSNKRFSKARTPWTTASEYAERTSAVPGPRSARTTAHGASHLGPSRHHASRSSAPQSSASVSSSSSLSHTASGPSQLRVGASSAIPWSRYPSIPCLSHDVMSFARFHSLVRSFVPSSCSTTDCLFVFLTSRHHQ